MLELELEGKFETWTPAVCGRYLLSEGLNGSVREQSGQNDVSAVQGRFPKLLLLKVGKKEKIYTGKGFT